MEQGEVFLVNLDPTIGAEIKKTRPCVIVSNNMINRYRQIVVVVPLTSNVQHLSPSHLFIPKGIANLDQDSKAVAEHIKSVDKRRLIHKIGALPESYLDNLLLALNNTFAKL
ncbi:type II toxin-antitoxin system PemK/MazF family toxin [bacterium]|nr:type II toxin-antitoxin system PemK/MazF family toxin [bacterium]